MTSSTTEGVGGRPKCQFKRRKKPELRMFLWLRRSSPNHYTEGERWRISSGLQASRIEETLSKRRRQKRHQVRVAVETHSRARDNQRRSEPESILFIRCCASLRKSDVAGTFKCCGVVPSPAVKAKNNITMATQGGRGGDFSRPGGWVKTGLGNSTRRCQGLMLSGCHRNFVKSMNQP